MSINYFLANKILTIILLVKSGYETESKTANIYTHNYKLIYLFEHSYLYHNWLPTPTYIYKNTKCQISSFVGFPHLYFTGHNKNS